MIVLHVQTTFGSLLIKVSVADFTKTVLVQFIYVRTSLMHKQIQWLTVWYYILAYFTQKNSEESIVYTKEQLV